MGWCDSTCAASNVPELEHIRDASTTTILDRMQLQEPCSICWHHSSGAGQSAAEEAHMTTAGLICRLTRPARECRAVELSFSRSSAANDSPPAMGDSVVPYASLATPAFRKYFPCTASIITTKRSGAQSLSFAMTMSEHMSWLHTG